MLRLRGLTGSLGMANMLKLKDVLILKTGDVSFVLKVISTLSTPSAIRNLKLILEIRHINIIVGRDGHPPVDASIVVTSSFIELKAVVVN